MATIYIPKCRHCDSKLKGINYYKYDCGQCKCFFIYSGYDNYNIEVDAEQYYTLSDNYLLIENKKWNCSNVRIITTKDVIIHTYKFEGFKDLDFHHKRLYNAIKALIL